MNADPTILPVDQGWCHVLAVILFPFYRLFASFFLVTEDMFLHLSIV